MQVGKAISDTLKNSVDLSLIISPYISNLETLINFSKIKEAKIICNAESPSCNPYTLLKLINNKNIKIKTRNDVHAKVYLFDSSAFITSANATNNGLGDGTIEASFKINDKHLIKELKEWFLNIWDNNYSQDVSSFDQITWERLKSNWNLNNNHRKRKKSLYDLIISKKIPSNISFAFWRDDDSDTKKEDVEKEAENIFELPKNNDHWDFYIEDDNYSSDKPSDLGILEKLTSKYYNHIIINFKISQKKDLVNERIEAFPSKILDRPIVFKKSLLTLYRKDNINLDFDITDLKVNKLLRLSQKKNKKAWDKYKGTEDGRFYYCSTKQLYELVENCCL